MKNNSLVSLLFYTFFISIIYSQNQAIISYEVKYANGSGSSIDYFENILDVNYYFDNGLYLFSQLEYSNPPLLGRTTNEIDDLFNIFYIQYNNPKYDITLGNLYLLYGKGLSLHTFEDQTIDFDNSPMGINVRYYLNDNIELYSSFGNSNVKSRINPADILPSVSIENNLGSFGISTFYEKASIHYHTLVYKQFYDFLDISNLMNLTNSLGQYLHSRSDIILLTQPKDDMTNLEHNIGVDFYIDKMQLYLGKSVVYYDKLLGERIDGYKDYVTVYSNIFNFDLLIEYKDYNTPFLYNVFSAPPIAFRESSSVLSSRNLHSIDFSNELGYLFEINKLFNNSLNMIFSYSFAMHHVLNEKEPSVFKFYSRKDINEIQDFWPYKQYYIEFSNTSKTGSFYYKVGYDYYYEITALKTIEAKTLPMHYSYNFKTGNSVSFYLEAQNKNEVNSNEKHDYVYFNPSYNHFGKWSVSLFCDYEKNGDLVNGFNYTFNLKESQFSIYLGSQKGGLVCANGSCIMQPDFEEGMKISYLTNF